MLVVSLWFLPLLISVAIPPQVIAFSSSFRISHGLSSVPSTYVPRKVPLAPPPLLLAELGSSSNNDDKAHSKTQVGVDKIFDTVDTDGSGAIDQEEYNRHLSAVGYSNDEIQSSFMEMDANENGLISRDEFRRAILTKAIAREDEEEAGADEENYECPTGYFLNSVKQTYEPLGPIGRISQKVETLGPFKKAYNKISNLFGIDTKKISKLGVSFVLSYSLISNLNGAMSFSVAWYMSIKRTGLSPMVPGQWKSLLTSYAMIYGAIQILRPFRVAAAIAMSKLSAEYLEMTQSKLNCSRGVAIGCQYLMGQLMMGVCALTGITFVSLLTGVPIMG